ncbi:membrane protein [Microbacterium phage Potty]|nr:membrane protein [Microbacterium phage Potty]
MGANEKHDAAYHGGLPEIKDCGQSFTPHHPHYWRVMPDGTRTHVPGQGVVVWCDRREEGSQADATPEAEAPKKQELGPVGKWVVGIVALAIVTPFVAILWAWAAEVVRSFG